MAYRWEANVDELLRWTSALGRLEERRPRRALSQGGSRRGLEVQAPVQRWRVSILGEKRGRRTNVSCWSGISTITNFLEPNNFNCHPLGRALNSSMNLFGSDTSNGKVALA